MSESVAIAESSAVPAAAGSPDAEQLAVEHVFARSTAVGALVGAAVCAAIWIGLMALAVGGERGFGAMIWVGAVCGAFAGLFLGGWAGALVGVQRLEHHEHESLQ